MRSVVQIQYSFLSLYISLYIYVCACVCVCTFVTYEDTNLYNDMGITRRRWFMRTFPHVPIFQKTYKSYRISFFEKVKCTKFPVRGRFRCRVGVGQWKIWFVQMVHVPTIHKNKRVCVSINISISLSIYLYLYIYIYIYISISIYVRVCEIKNNVKTVIFDYYNFK